MTTWVADASPLLYLALLEKLHLLQAEGHDIVIPGAVLDEVRGHDDPAARAIEEATKSWLRVRDPSDPLGLAVLGAGLGTGEAAGLALALELGAERLVVDDLDARRACRRLGMPVVGTLGILLAAKHAGRLGSMRSALDRLEAAKFRVSPRLRKLVLSAAGEPDSGVEEF